MNQYILLRLNLLIFTESLSNMGPPDPLGHPRDFFFLVICMQDFIPWIESAPLAVEVQSPDH